MRLKHWIALILTCTLAAGTLAGCGGPAKKAMGRYAEEPLALPETVGRPLYTAMNADGALVYYAYGEGNSVLRYTQPVDGEAVGEPVAWLNGLLGENDTVSSLSESPNGRVYAIVSEIAADGAGKNALYRSTGGQAAEVIDMPDWSGGGNVFVQRGQAGGGARASSAQAGPPTRTGPGQGAPAGPGGGPQGGRGPMDIGQMPQGVTALDDGFLVSYMMGNVVQYDETGQKVREYSAGDAAMGGRIGGGVGSGTAVFGNTLALADTGAQEILLYDLTTGEKTGVKPFDGLDGSTYIGLDKDGQNRGSLLLGDATGVYRDTDLGWEMVVDGGLTSLVMPTLSIEGLFDDGTGTYYAFLSGDTLTGGGGMQLLRFAFDESLPAQPDTTLEVFSLNDSSTVRLAIGAFQRKNPNVRVNLEVGLEDSEAATAGDVVRALHTRLLAGKGPDILILDGLPIQSYIREDVLEDITELAGELGASEGLMRNLTNAYAKDGKVYGLPALFGLPAMVGTKDTLAQFTSLEALVDAVKYSLSHSRPYGAEITPILRAPDSLYDENTGMLMDYYEACAGSFTNADGGLDEAALAAYLTDALALSDALKAVTPQATDERRMGFFMAVTNGRQSVSMDPRAIMDVAQGNALSCVQQITGMGPLMMVFSQLGGDGDMALQSLFGQNQFYPRCGAGIVSASKQRDLAEEFIAMLLSAEVQDSNLFDGLPVNGASLQKIFDDLKDGMAEMGGTEIGDMGFIALCKGLTAPLFTDETVKAAVSARMKSLLDGSMTPEEAAAKIVADTKLYLAE